MAILGVLLGITMTVLAAVIVYGYHELKKLREFKKAQMFVIEDHDLRIQRLAYPKHKTVPVTDTGAEGGTIGFGPAPRVRAGRASVRTWNEDIGAAE